jgi:SnoaL-like domain
MTIDRALAERWLGGYEHAWASNAPADIEALFTPDARYLPGPWEEPWEGRAAIVASWLQHRDAPGTYRFSGRLLALDGDLATFIGTTTYLPPHGDPMGGVYANVWLVRLTDSGTARRFEEWWIMRSGDAPAGESQRGEGAGTLPGRVRPSSAADRSA